MKKSKRKQIRRVSLRQFNLRYHFSRRPYFLIPFTIVFLVFIFYLVIVTTPLNRQHATVIIEIKSGATLPQIAQQLYDLGIINNQRRFRLAAFLMRRDTKLRAGRFNLKRAANYYELIRTLADWENGAIKVVIPEGYTSRQIAQLLRARIGMPPERFLSLVKDKNVARSYGFDAPSLEGYLFPATYYFLEGDSPEYVIQRMVERFREVWTDSLQNLALKRGMTSHQVLTIASIVEGECMVDSERPIVASLYYNRLKRHKRLEADPTIQYIIPDSPRRLKREDLRIDSPYNTYRYAGLPPGPINNPGLKSIKAAINPARTKYLYMVSNGDSTHTFATNYEEFLIAKRRLQQIRRQLAEASQKEVTN